MTLQGKNRFDVKKKTKKNFSTLPIISESVAPGYRLFYFISISFLVCSVQDNSGADCVTTMVGWNVKKWIPGIHPYLAQNKVENWCAAPRWKAPIMVVSCLGLSMGANDPSSRRALKPQSNPMSRPGRVRLASHTNIEFDMMIRALHSRVASSGDNEHL